MNDLEWLGGSCLTTAAFAFNPMTSVFGSTKNTQVSRQVVQAPKSSAF